MKPSRLFVVFVALAFHTCAAQSPAGPVAFVHANVIPMDREVVLKDQTVMVDSGKIVAVGPSSRVKVPAGAQRIDASGKYLLPGFTDAHVHLQTPIEFPLFLANGVTTVFNLDGRPAHLLWRKKIASGEMLGPTIVTTGPIIGRPHTPEQAVKIVDEIAAAGYDGVKIYNPVSKEEYPALIAEAKRKNLLLMGHVARGPEFEMTVESGQSIAHLEEFTYTYFNPQHDNKNRHIVYDESKIPAVVKITAASGVFVTPTLCTYAQIVQQATEIESFLKRTDLKYTAPWLLEAFQPATNRYKNGFGPDSYAQIRTSLAFQRKLVKALQQGGVPLMSGTDASDVGPVAGFSIHDELQELVGDGLTPFQALQTTTVNPARYFRLAGEAGTVEPGRRADLLLLDHNPLGDISATRQIAGVMVHGRWLPAADLRKMQEQVPREYQRQIHQIEQQIGNDPARAEEFLKDNDPLGNLGPAAITGLLASHDFPAFEKIIHKVRETNPQSNLASEETINNLGYRLLNNKRNQDALLLFRLNTQDFPRSANAFDSLGEALFNSGDEPAAVAAYQHALEIDPKYPNAEAAAKFVEEHGKKK